MTHNIFGVIVLYAALGFIMLLILAAIRAK